MATSESNEQASGTGRRAVLGAAVLGAGGTVLGLAGSARAALGARYDMRDFNDAVVTTGGAPLAVLESVIDRYVAGAKAA